MIEHRIIGFDIARAYAIFGMYIVNFNFSFGSIWQTEEPVGRFLNLFTGNSTAIFILLAGMGVSFMTSDTVYSKEEKTLLRSKIVKRSMFLFALGLLLYDWWPGDILHFYGGYMHIAAFLVFLPKRYYLWVAVLAIFIFHILLYILPIETGWDFTTFRYTDFWTVAGFLRNTFYNGWNALFPWMSYFAVGMWLGRLNWNDKLVKRNVFIAGLVLFTIFQGLRYLVTLDYFNDYWDNYIISEYFPAYLPFIMITMGFALMVITACMYIGGKFPANSIISALAKTGRLTLSLYILHLTLGAILLARLTGKHYTGFAEDETPTQPLYILAYAACFYIAGIVFSVVWLKKFRNGPVEMLMRKISG